MEFQPKPAPSPSQRFSQARADPNAADLSGEPPLIEAACCGDLEAQRAERGAVNGERFGFGVFGFGLGFWGFGVLSLVLGFGFGVWFEKCGFEKVFF